MSLTLANAEEKLEHLLVRLEELMPHFAAIHDTASDARAEYKLAWATAFRQADGTVDARKAQADIISHPANLAKERAEGRERALRDTLDATKEAMGACRTVMASSRV